MFLFFFFLCVCVFASIVLSVCVFVCLCVSYERAGRGILQIDVKACRKRMDRQTEIDRLTDR